MMEAETVSLADGFALSDASYGKVNGRSVQCVEPEAGICSTRLAEAEGFEPLRYRFRIQAPGRYWLRMHMLREVHCVDEGTDGDKCHSGAGCESYGVEHDGASCDGANRCWRKDISNDFYVGVEDASGQAIDHVGGDASLMKFFGGGNNGAFAWSGDQALDHNKPLYALEEGDYTLLVRCRSRGAYVDQILLHREDVDIRAWSTVERDD